MDYNNFNNDNLIKKKVSSMINNIYKTYEKDILHLELSKNVSKYRIKEINELLNDVNIEKMRKINNIDFSNYKELNKAFADRPDILLLQDYLNEMKIENEKMDEEIIRKRIFYEKLREYVFSMCDHSWISDHFENSATMTMQGITYCSSCGMKMD